MEEEYGQIDAVVVSYISDLMFGTGHPQNAQKTLVEEWYSHSGLKETLHCAVTALDEPSSGACTHAGPGCE